MMNSPSTYSSSPGSARRSRRTKTVSSLQGMFQDAPVPPIMDKHQQSLDDLKSVDSFDSIDHIKYNNNNNAAERDSLRLMSRKLRQAKRKLFLKKVETPVEPVDKLRDILLKLSMDGGTFSDEYSTSVNSFTNE